MRVCVCEPSALDTQHAYTQDFEVRRKIESKGGRHTVKEVPIWEKSNLTLEEAAAYSGIGINKLRKMSDSEKCPFVLWIGSKRLIKRKQLDDYTASAYSL